MGHKYFFQHTNVGCASPKSKTRPSHGTLCVRALELQMAFEGVPNIFSGKTKRLDVRGVTQTDLRQGKDFQTHEIAGYAARW